jgi:hypothetical protein
MLRDIHHMKNFKLKSWCPYITLTIRPQTLYVHGKVLRENLYCILEAPYIQQFPS